MVRRKAKACQITTELSWPQQKRVANKHTIASTHLLVLVSDCFGFFVSLKPHHVPGVKSPGLFFQGFRC